MVLVPQRQDLCPSVCRDHKLQHYFSLCHRSARDWDGAALSNDVRGEVETIPWPPWNPLHFHVGSINGFHSTVSGL